MMPEKEINYIIDENVGTIEKDRYVPYLQYISPERDAEYKLCDAEKKAEPQVNNAYFFCLMPFYFFNKKTQHGDHDKKTGTFQAYENIRIQDHCISKAVSHYIIDAEQNGEKAVIEVKQLLPFPDRKEKDQVINSNKGEDAIYGYM